MGKSQVLENLNFAGGLYVVTPNTFLNDESRAKKKVRDLSNEGRGGSPEPTSQR